MDIKVYEPYRSPCKICENKDSELLPICVIEGEHKMYPVCRECIDKVPYEIIPVKSVMDEGYYYCPDLPGWRTLTKTPLVLDPDWDKRPKEDK